MILNLEYNYCVLDAAVPASVVVGYYSDTSKLLYMFHNLFFLSLITSVMALENAKHGHYYFS